MAKYRVYLEAVASVSIEVEAADQDSAIAAAFEHTPSAAWDWPDMGDWYFPPDERAALKAEDYIEQIEPKGDER